LRLALGTATPSAAGSTASLGRYPKTAAVAAALGRRSRQNSVSSGSGGHGTPGDPCRAPGCTRLLRQSQMKTIFFSVLNGQGTTQRTAKRPCPYLESRKNFSHGSRLVNYRLADCTTAEQRFYKIDLDWVMLLCSY
jgi:hypothetical protein